ncbi:MAG TPA: PKD domain-containing protein [Dongiaceae bacterium]|nr:PKD domain-containing protein [Dongiaceae bacterium]
MKNQPLVFFAAAFACILIPGCASTGNVPPPRIAHRTVDLNLGEGQDVRLSDGSAVRVKLLNLEERRDEVNGAVRQAVVQIEVDGQLTNLTSGTYHLPVTFGGVQIDCPITKVYLEKSGGQNPWGLLKDARLRLWPAGSPWIAPDTFVYPAKQRWFASFTQMANEPVYVDGGELPAKKEIYYHFGLDMGGSEGLVDVVSATEGTVTSSGNEVLAGQAPDAPAEPRYDNVYILDARGWYCRYSHLKFIDPAVRPGARIALGQKLGVLGKEGGSGGWSHLHFDIWARQPSGLWGIEEGYAFLWQAYQQEHPLPLVAVARPHALLWAGQKAVLDGSRSHGRGLRFEWLFTDGGSAAGERVERTYEKAGTYCETLKVTDEAGRVDYDFMAVQVIDRAHPDQPPPTIHANYAPTFGIRPGDPVVFKVRTFRDKTGGETWNFGDGTPTVTVKSDANAVRQAPNGYAEARHIYDQPGRYLVSVEHVSAEGVPAVARLQVRVGIE